VPADTPASSPVETTVEIEGGKISMVSIHFPAGCNGMVYVAIFHGIKQLYPWTDGQYFRGNNETIIIHDDWKLPESKITLTIKAHSPGTLYDHTILIRIVTTRAEEYEEESKARTALVKLLTFLKEVIGVD